MNNASIGRRHFERAMEASTLESRALSLYNAMGLLIGFDNVEESLREAMGTAGAERYLGYVLRLVNEADREDGCSGLAPTPEDLDAVTAALRQILGD